MTTGQAMPGCVSWSISSIHLITASEFTSNKHDYLVRRELIDMQQEFEIYARAVASSGEQQDFTMLLATVENTKRVQAWELSAEKGRMMGEAFAKREQEGGDDDDVRFEGEDAMAGLTCSLTMKLPTNPVVSRVCHHVFERDAIINWINQNGRGQVQCPKAGCSASFGKGDLTVDKEICERIKKAKNSQLNDWEELD